MHIFAVSPPILLAQELQEEEFHPDRWLWVVPTITAIAIGLIFVPYFSFGLAVGGAEFIVVTTGVKLLERAGILDNKVDTPDVENLFGASLTPLSEEALFRGGIQPNLAQIIQHTMPVTQGSFLRTDLNVATAVSILTTSAFFGAMHLFNENKRARLQAITSGLGGIMCGVLAAQMGIYAALAGHISFNALHALSQSFLRDGTDSE